MNTKDSNLSTNVLKKLLANESLSHVKTWLESEQILEKINQDHKSYVQDKKRNLNLGSIKNQKLKQEKMDWLDKHIIESAHSLLGSLKFAYDQGFRTFLEYDGLNSCIIADVGNRGIEAYLIKDLPEYPRTVSFNSPFGQEIKDKSPGTIFSYSPLLFNGKSSSSVVTCRFFYALHQKSRN